MEHSKTPSAPLIDLRSEDIDPWNEFLSESSEELQQPAPDHSDRDGDYLHEGFESDDQALADAARTDAASRSIQQETAPSVVRVSIAELPAMHLPADEAPLPSTNAPADLSPSAQSGSNVPSHLASIASMPDVDPGPVSLAEALSRAVEQSRTADVPAASRAAVSPASAGIQPSIDAITTLGQEPRADTRLVAAGSLSLREVLRRHTPLHWSEAVATVEALCLELTATHREPPIPDLTDISITSDGRVTLRPDAPGDTDVATLGRTLHALLVTATTPLPLRLFVTSSISSDRYKSVALYLDALSYYATPDRASLIQALYARALISVAPMAPPRALPVEHPLQPREDVASPVAIAARRSLPTIWIGIFAGLVLGTVSAFWFWPTAPRVPARPIRAEAVTPTQPPHDDWQPAPVQVPPTVKQRPPLVARTRAADQPALAPTVVVPPIESSNPLRPLPSSPIVPLPARPRPEPLPESRSVPVPPPSPLVPAAVDSTIYSEADREVVPPALLSRRPVLTDEASGNGANGPTSFELVIDHNGDVQSARLVGRPARMTDMNTQQMVKGLKFRPATKEGRAVTFKYVLTLEAPPR